MRGLAAALLVLAACVEAPPTVGSLEQASEVGDYETSTCSTAVVIELSRQIAAEVDCMAPGQLVPFSEGNGIVFAGAAVLPYVSELARSDLLAAVADGGGTQLQVTSAYRTVVQQYLLWRWLALGRCGITAAADPGMSNHESGRAIDVSNYDAWIAALGAHRWDHSVPGDPVHFDHTMSPDLRGTDTLAFQRLWNRNNPGDLIDEDGVWGAMTEARVKMATAEGFPIGPMCAPGGFDVALESLDATRELETGETGGVTMVLRNRGTATWPAGSALVTAVPAGRASPFADDSWPAADRAQTLDAAVASGAVWDLTFSVVAPAEPGEYTENFSLEAGGQRFGMIAVVFQVREARGDGSGGLGCSAGGRVGWIPLLAVLFLVGRRRKLRA